MLFLRASELEEKHQAMGKSIINRTYDYGKGIFRDTADSDHCALHANALQLFFGLEPPKGYKPIVDFIMKKRLNCGVYFAYFVIKGLYTVGEHEAAYDLLTGRDGHSWYNMIKSGATTSMEAWGPEQKWNTSWCHPWSSSPIYFYTAEIMGIKGAAPGMKKIKITPKINESLNYATIKIPVPKGEITASFKRTENGCVYTVNAPSDIEIEFEGNDINFEFNYTDYI